MHERGQRLGRYTLQRQLGRGGSAEVWAALLHGPRGFERPVALKLLTDTRRGLEGLIREARVGALLHHPNVVSIHDLGEVDDIVFVAMELVRGGTLRDLLREMPLPPSVVLEIGLQVCAGLQHIHALRGLDGGPLVHRDLKPSNLLLDPAGVVKIADLGIAMHSGTAGPGAGTTGYAPPEQYQGHVDPRSDLFALGATLFATAVRSPAFQTGGPLTVERVSVALLRGDLVRRADQAIPGLGAVVRSCLAARPDDRPESAAALAKMLEDVRDDAPHGPTLHDVVRPFVQERGSGAQETSTGGHTPVVSASGAPTLVLEGNLPMETDRFLGRETEISDLLTLARSDARLVTLVGPGGMGKTRLSLAVARVLSPELVGGAWFFDLADAKDQGEICRTVATGLSFVLAQDDPGTQVGHAWRSRGRCVVVLDNLEHLIDEVVPLIKSWLDLAPSVTFLGTSRVALRLRGERRMMVGPLSEDDAVALFTERAPLAVRSGEKKEILALVRALGGMPLAVELCAARADVMSVGELRLRLDERLSVLRATDRDRPDRHRSIAACLAWSWDLLSPRAKDALAQLSVFDGGCSLEGAEAVLDLTAHGDGWAIDVLQELADASLVRADIETGRFTLLFVVQAFAAERLVGEERARAEERHGRFFAQLGSPEVLEGLLGHGGGARLRQLACDTPNLVASARRALLVGDIPVAVRSALAAGSVLVRAGPVQSVIDLLDPLLDVGLDTPAHVDVCLMIGSAWAAQGRWELVADLLAPLVRRTGAGRDVRRSARVRHLLVVARLAQDRVGDAEGLGIEAVEESRAVGDATARASALSALGLTRLQQLRYADGVACFEEALAIHQAQGDGRATATVLSKIGTAWLRSGDSETSRSWFQLALAAARDAGDRTTEAFTLMQLGLMAKDALRTAEAHAVYNRALGIARDVGDRHSEAYASGAIGYLYLEQGDPERAEEPLRLARDLNIDMGSPASACQWVAALGRLAARRGDRMAARTQLDDARMLLGDNQTELVVWLLCAEADIAIVFSDRGRAEQMLRDADAFLVRRGLTSSRAAAEIARVRRQM